MKLVRSRKIVVTAVLLIGTVLLFTFTTRHEAVDFNTQVKPIINENCITCHGGVKAKAGFSLLFRSEALANTESGKPAIVPGAPDESEMIRRLTLNDPEERMPYQHPALSDDEIDILRRWIKQGAKWGNHWSYVSVKQVEVPENDWGRNDIDHFIFEKLEDADLEPSPVADKATLLRRVSIDLTGLPPSPELAQKFLSDKSPTAFESLVDSLLASKGYGERWTAMWMDLARYADTKGYERDFIRNIWRYRDWLIKAFNDDKPYNKFLTEQIAGDLMPGATDNDYIATAFHRNTMTNDEGGTDNEEFRTAAVLDRVNTTWETLMGTTFACVQCHSHPYDPFKHEDYYKFMAFFNNTRDEDTEDDYPLLRHFDTAAEQKLKQLNTWLSRNADAASAKKYETLVKTWQPSINSLTADQFVNSELMDTKWLVFRNNGSARLKRIDLNNKKELIFRYNGFVKQGTWSIYLDSIGGKLLKKINLKQTKDWKWSIASVDLENASGVHDLYLTFYSPELKDPLANGALFDWFHFSEGFPAKDKPGYKEAHAIFWELLRADFPGTPIMMDNPKELLRSTHVFERGNWLVKGDEVAPGVPESLNPWPSNAPPNRLGLAMWMTDTKNPLTARTMVNRLWEQLYGQGLVETLEDFGSQGAAPTHKELLDHLSWKFMHEYKWSVKKLLREMVLSATYQQDTKVSDELLDKDPYNTLYARGPRIRLSAEQLRDQGLAISGLLSEKIYGPSVMPYQPAGLWLSPWNGLDWEKSRGEDQYRRALYTYWKRTAPYPSMITFDGAAREVCTSRRIRTNTPLQALVTLNDEAYVEMARHFAYRMQEKAGNDVVRQIKTGYELALYKPISNEKLNVLKRLYDGALQRFKADPDKTCEMVGVMDEHNNPQTAALVVVANAILNLDELITKN
jgi:hypothetical protein